MNWLVKNSRLVVEKGASETKNEISMVWLNEWLLDRWHRPAKPKMWNGSVRRVQYEGHQI
jgi:hypothetical protein